MSESTDESDKNGLGTWWYVAAALMLAVVIGAAAVIWHGRGGATAAPTSSSSAVTSSTISLTGPSTAGAADPWSSQRGCAATAGTGSMNAAAVSGIGWQPVGRSSAPISQDLGPTKIQGPLRECYQHSPAGALVAAVNILAALGSDAQSAKAVAAQQITAGSWRDELMSQDDSGTGSGIGTPAGYQIGGCQPDRCLVSVAFYGSGMYYTAGVTLLWSGQDWQLTGASSPSVGRGMTSVPAGWSPWAP